MKQFLIFILAAFTGATIAISLVPTKTIIETKEINAKPVSNVETYSNTPFNFVLASEKVTPAVVHIKASESQAMAKQRYEERRNRRNSPFDFFGFDDFLGGFQPRDGTGSGVIISNDGYIVTNNHVIDGADIINVSLTDKRTFKATLIGKDPSTDLALLKIEADDLTSVKFADSDGVRVGEWVAAIGNPFSYLESTVTAGIVSAKGRDLDIIKGQYNIEEFIQTDAAINPGNSGGALVNPQGDLIGINTAIATPTGVYAGYSFAIPSNIVQRIIKDLKENGNIERGRLGIAGFELDQTNSQELGLRYDTGFYVENVLKGSGAQFAGVLPGDIIYKANDVNVKTFDDLLGVVEFSKVGDKIKLGIVRKNKEMELDVFLRKGI